MPLIPRYYDPIRYNSNIAVSGCTSVIDYWNDRDFKKFEHYRKFDLL
jgi:hypothetical protein